MTAQPEPVIHLNDGLEFIAYHLQTQGWCIVPDFMSPGLVTSLRDELLAQWRSNEFRPAGIGRGETYNINNAIRGDAVKWLIPAELTPALAEYWQTMENLRLYLNRTLYLGLFEFEAHMSIYKPGSFYRRHVDQFRDTSLREVTTTFYLNADWQEQDGGQLLLFNKKDAEHELARITPHAGQIVVFMSGEFPHEVLPASKQRLSVTGWFKKRALS